MISPEGPPSSWSAIRIDGAERRLPGGDPFRCHRPTTPPEGDQSLVTRGVAGFAPADIARDGKSSSWKNPMIRGDPLGAMMLLTEVVTVAIRGQAAGQ